MDPRDEWAGAARARGWAGGRRRRGLVVAVTGAAVVGIAATIEAARADPTDVFAELTLEELANIKITSVSKRSESLSDAPAAIFVISNDDIRRSGATTLPEALRLAPNLEVARVDARNYAITARGFNNVLANKLLVLIDGRTVYSPLFSGVYWDAQDVVLEDIERIEVVSGPGGTLWGANAVNGVINVITRSSADTQGALVAPGAGDDTRIGTFRYGGALGDGGHYRVYGKYLSADDLENASGQRVPTGMHRVQGGFRTDWDDATRKATVQGDAYHGALHQDGTRDIAIDGANLTGRLVQQHGGDSELTLQGYWDYTARNQPNAFDEHLHTFDVHLQDAFTVADANRVVVGGGYRIALDRVQPGPSFGFLPGTLNLYWADVYAQDEVALSKTLRLTGGLRLENNNYTGTEWLPTIRLAWKPSDQRLVWTSLSRAVRIPSRIDHDFYTPPDPPIVGGVRQYAIAGGPDFQSEIADVVELGIRDRPAPSLSYSATVFASRYSRLRTLEPGTGGQRTMFRNEASGRSRGVELWGSWQAAPPWRLSAGWVAQKLGTQLDAGSNDISRATSLASADPSNHWLLRSSFDLTRAQDLDLTLRHSGALDRAVPSYTTLDVRYAWRPRRDIELSIVGLNVIGPRHAEFSTGPSGTSFDRSVFLKLAWRS